MGHHHPAPLQEARRLPPLDHVALAAVGDGRPGTRQHGQRRRQGRGRRWRVVVERVRGREGLGHARKVLERNGTDAEGAPHLRPHLLRLAVEPKQAAVFTGVGP